MGKFERTAVVMTQKPVVILGAGGHAKVLGDALRLCGVPIIGATSAATDADAPWQLAGIERLGDDEAVLALAPHTVALVNGLGSTRSTQKRARLFATFKAGGFTFHPVIHPTAILAADSQWGEGVQILAASVIGPGTKLGNNIIINTGAIIDHDCWIADHCHLAPGCTLSGGVRVGEGVHIGSGATVIQGITIGAQSIIGAGAVVYRSVATGSTLVGYGRILP